MNPDEIQITNVFVRETGGSLDNTLPWAGPNQIVVQWAAGATANANPAVDIQFHIAIWDQTAGGLLGGAEILPPLVGPDGTNENRIYETTAGLPNLGAAPGGVYKAFVSLTRGVAGATVAASYEGPVFFGV